MTRKMPSMEIMTKTSKYDAVTESLTAESAARERMQGSSTDSSTDRRLYNILNDANVECFSTLEEALPFI
jgi:hypothetical protein